MTQNGSHILRALSPLGNSALLINFSGRSKETKTFQVIVFAIVSRYHTSRMHCKPTFTNISNFHLPFLISQNACFRISHLRFAHFLEKSAWPLLQTNITKKVCYFPAQFLPCNRQTKICQKWINSNQCLTERNNREKELSCSMFGNEFRCTKTKLFNPSRFKMAAMCLRGHHFFPSLKLTFPFFFNLYDVQSTLDFKSTSTKQRF